MTFLEIDVWVVFFAASLTAIMTGAGALPFLFLRNISNVWIGISDAIAAGLMLAASHSLIVEGATLSANGMLLGLISGVVAIHLSNNFIEKNGSVSEIAELNGQDARKAILILGVMTAHSFAEGIGVGVSYGDSIDLGFYITLAIAIHNIPEGLAISLVLIPRGTPVWKAGAWSIFTSLPQPIMAVPAFLFVLIFKPLLPFGLGLAGGAMLWMVVAELIPDAIEKSSVNTVATMTALAFAAMLAVQILLIR